MSTLPEVLENMLHRNYFSALRMIVPDQPGSPMLGITKENMRHTRFANAGNYKGEHATYTFVSSHNVLDELLFGETG